MHKPLVSVLLTSYNQGQYLQESIESVLAQTLESWELIIIDNGSTDNSMEVARQYEKHPQVRIIHHPTNRPVTVNLNEGIRAARGEYFSLLQSDDYYLPEKLERQVAAFERLSEDYGVVYSNGYRLRSGGELILDPCGDHEGNVLEALLTQPAFFLPIAPLVRLRCLREFPFDESVFIEGEGVYAKIAIRYKFHPLPEPLVVMRELEGSLGREVESNIRRSARMYERLFAREDFPRDLQSLRGHALGGTYAGGGWQVLRRERRYDLGREWLLRGIRENPKLLLTPRVIVGLMIASLPRSLSDICMNALDRVIGTPPPLGDRPPTRVEGIMQPVADQG